MYLSFNRQEGVSVGIYRPLEVEVMTEDQKLIKCRTYEIVNPQLEYDKPSPQYLGIILTGARQIKLPSEYLHRLDQFKHNGNEKDVDLENKKVET